MNVNGDRRNSYNTNQSEGGGNSLTLDGQRVREQGHRETGGVRPRSLSHRGPDFLSVLAGKGHVILR